MGDAATIQEVDLDAVNLMDPEWFADGPPHELFARMRAEAPVRWNELPEMDGGGFWSLTRHEDISAVSRDTETFSSYRGGIFLHPDQVMPLEMNRNVLLFKDPPEHTKYRKILNNAFTPRTVAKLEDAIRARVTKAIDSVIEKGSCDFVTEIAVPTPLLVLMDLMGLPEEDMPRLAAWTEQIEEAQRSPEPAAATQTFIEQSEYLWQQVERQMKAEGDSLVTQLRKAEVDGEQLTDPEILMFYGLLGFAGNDTTRNTTSSGMLALLRNPDQLAYLRENPDAIEQAVEEILRFTSVVNYFARTATRDTEVGGQKISEGHKVVLWYTSASRDEDVYSDPQRFDLARAEHDHRAFGGGGRHFCLGAGLARNELKLIFEQVAERMPQIELAGEVEVVPSSWTYALASLPVSY
jgi:cholest-4-en-3-one 26-monooxygenase